MTLPQATAKRADLKNQKQKVVFTNGCFDLLHPGHLRYLAEARKLGHFLLVALNSDRSVRELKGPERPICPQEVRAEMLAGLLMVDAVLIFDEPTPLKVIEALSPDILVKGGDWPLDKIVGADFVLKHGGQVLPLILAEGFSSTNIVEHIKKLGH